MLYRYYCWQNPQSNDDDNAVAIAVAVAFMLFSYLVCWFFLVTS